MNWSHLPFAYPTTPSDVVECAAVLLLEQSCLDLIAHRLASHRSPPTLQEWLDACTFLFRMYPHRLTEEGRALGNCLLRAEIRRPARCRKQDTLASSVAVGRMRPLIEQDVQVLSFLFPTLRKVGTIYRTAYKRLPRGREVLAIVSTVLMVQGICEDLPKGAEMRIWIESPSSLTFWKQVRRLLRNGFSRSSGKRAIAPPVEAAKPPFQEQLLPPERLWVLREQASVSARIADEGFTVQHEADAHAVWAHTVGLSLGGAHADVLMVGLEPARTEALLRRLAERVLAGERFSAGQIIFDLTSDDLPVCFVAVEPKYIPQYARCALRYYASEDIPFLQCVFSDGGGKFPWQHEEGYFGCQFLLCAVTGIPFLPPPSLSSGGSISS